MIYANYYHILQQKAELHCCCSASRGSGIALNSEQTTLKPTPYVYVYADICAYI